VFQGRAKKSLEDLLPSYLRSRRWFGGKARKIKSTEITDIVPIPSGPSLAYVIFVQVEYTEGDPETYTVPIAFAGGERARELESQLGQTILARVRGKDADSEGILYPALRDVELARSLLEAIARRRRFKGQTGEISAAPTRAFRRLANAGGAPLEPSPLRAEQSNTSLTYGDRFILKVFRRLEEGVNPDLEIGRFLTERTGFRNIPPVAGELVYRRGRYGSMTLGILHGYVANEGDAWQYTLDTLSRYFEHAATQPCDPAEIPVSAAEPLDLLDQEVPARAAEAIGPYLESARLLGERTAELHIALASDPDDPDFAPEPFTALYQRSIYQSMRGLAAQAFELLRKRLRELPGSAREEARKVLEIEAEAQRRFRAITERKITAMRMRFHGDYHLGQVLFTGKDFIIIDFEGEPARPLSERRIKRSPLRDVAGMLRSFHYAAYSALNAQLSGGSLGPDGEAIQEAWARCWYQWVSMAFLKSYLATAAQSPFIPRTREELRVLLDAFLLEKACYELGYELNNRPDWARLPLLGLLQILRKKE
jgi:maltose alpha-D-glucosyltransferase/alpha-amylase